jgi:hypothetical protein
VVESYPLLAAAGASQVSDKEGASGRKALLASLSVSYLVVF